MPAFVVACHGMRLWAGALVTCEHDGQPEVSVVQQAPHEMRQALGAHVGDFQDLLLVAQASGKTEVLLKDLRRGFACRINVPAVWHAPGVIENALEVYSSHCYSFPMNCPGFSRRSVAS